MRRSHPHNLDGPRSPLRSGAQLVRPAHTVVQNPAEGMLWWNEESETCPPYGIIEAAPATSLQDGTGEDFLTGGKPAASVLHRTYWINGPNAVEHGKFGRCFSAVDQPRVALCYGVDNGYGGTPIRAAGPTVGEWHLQSLRTGFRPLGDANSLDRPDGMQLLWVLQEPGPVIFTAAASGDVDATDASFAVSGLNMLAGICPVAELTDQVTVRNMLRLEMTSSEEVLVIEDQEAGGFTAVAGYRSRFSDVRAFLLEGQSHEIIIDHGVIRSWTLS